jgi:hypothetical protein
MFTMLKELYSIDIETVSQGAVADAYTESMTIKTGNTKDEEKLKAKIEEGRAKARASHGLSWITGKIFCVSVTNIMDNTTVSFIGFDESVILKDLAHYLNVTLSEMSRLYGKSSKDFDYPFLTGRYIANGIDLPRILRKPTHCQDIDDLLSYSKQSGQRGKLSDYAHGMGVTGKSMHGSMIQDEYNRAILADKESQQKILADVVAYCTQDTAIVAEFVRRYYNGHDN